MKLFSSLLVVCLSTHLLVAQPQKPLKVAVYGLVHTHVHWILGREPKGDIEIVAIIEPNRELAQRYSTQHGYSMDIVFDSFESMIRKVKPEAVTAFNTIYDHLQVVKECAPLGIHVMVEKPLAVSLEHAQEMEALAQKHNILLVTNYETTWYPTTDYVLDSKQKLGTIRKVVIHDGHQGPVKIGVNQEFLEWLTDPKWNRAGALTDFGCYGANLVTALTGNQKPQSVLAVTQQLQPQDYPNVDDEATIILTYPDMQAIIQASWNWSYSRKDWEVYGTSGHIRTIDGSDLLQRIGSESTESRLTIPSVKAANDPFSYLAGAVNGTIDSSTDLSSLKNNMIVMEILDAAMKSAKTGKVIYLE